MPRDVSHIIVGTDHTMLQMLCESDGKTLDVATPKPLQEILDEVKHFVRAHRDCPHCPHGAGQPAEPPKKGKRGK